jgi:hypothetical protein
MAQRKKLQKHSEQRLGLHRRQLFHWIGSDIESDRKLSAQERAEKYVGYLEFSLAKGLWLKPPREKDTLGAQCEFQVVSPICCFTETTLDEIEFHNREYGRLGLGFPKRFILSNGGKPVNYVNDVNSDPSFKSWDLLRRRLADDRLLEIFSQREVQELQREFAYLTQFLKRIKIAYANKGKPAKPKIDSSQAIAPVSKSTEKPVSFKRNYGGILHYLEEREWRIVVKENSNRIRSKALVKNTADKGPVWFLPYVPARDLFTIVFPDNRTLAMAMANSKIRRRVHSQNQPPVTVLSLEDLGTF